MEAFETRHEFIHIALKWLSAKYPTKPPWDLGAPPAGPTTWSLVPGSVLACSSPLSEFHHPRSQSIGRHTLREGTRMSMAELYASKEFQKFMLENPEDFTNSLPSSATEAPCGIALSASHGTVHPEAVSEPRFSPANFQRDQRHRYVITAQTAVCPRPW